MVNVYQDTRRMSIHSILAKPIWQSLSARPGFASLSAAAIEAADSYFNFLLEHGLNKPTAADVVLWHNSSDCADWPMAFELLEEAFSVIEPNFLRTVANARNYRAPSAPKVKSKDQATDTVGGRRPTYEAVGWDPIAPPEKRPPIPRKFSIPAEQLPEPYKATLRRAADGLPGIDENIKVPARSMVVRMREKICQYFWTIAKHELAPEMSIVGIDSYVSELTGRYPDRGHGPRWASLRASVDGLYLLARLHGEANEVMTHLRSYLREFNAREKAQRALKFFELARTGQTTDSVLDQADRLLAGVDAELRPKKRFQMRNGAAILAIFANAPLRNASSQLCFGISLFWDDNHWIIKTKIQKTHDARPELLVLPLHPECGKFVDAIILGDASPVMLPTLRMQALATQRQLFCLYDETPAAATYVPRIFKQLTGNSFTTLRVMHYSDAITHHGAEGIELARPAAHHSPATTSADIVKVHYIAEGIGRLHADRFRARRGARTNAVRDRYRSEFSLSNEA
jgi:hypothetical protein